MELTLISNTSATTLKNARIETSHQVEIAQANSQFKHEYPENSGSVQLFDNAT